MAARIPLDFSRSGSQCGLRHKLSMATLLRPTRMRYHPPVLSSFPCRAPGGWGRLLARSPDRRETPVVVSLGLCHPCNDPGHAIRVGRNGSCGAHRHAPSSDPNIIEQRRCPTGIRENQPKSSRAQGTTTETYETQPHRLVNEQTYTT